MFGDTFTASSVPFFPLDELGILLHVETAGAVLGGRARWVSNKRKCNELKTEAVLVFSRKKRIK